MAKYLREDYRNNDKDYVIGSAERDLADAFSMDWTHAKTKLGSASAAASLALTLPKLCSPGFNCSVLW